MHIFLAFSMSACSDEDANLDMDIDLEEMFEEIDQFLEENVSNQAEAETPIELITGNSGQILIQDLPDNVLERIAMFTSVPRTLCRRLAIAAERACRARVRSALDKLGLSGSARRGGGLCQLVRAIENAMYTELATPVLYRAKARELLFNLKHDRGAALRARVTSGDVTPRALVRMTSQELASPELKEARAEATRLHIQQVTMPKVESGATSFDSTVTDRFTCGNCGYGKTSYRCIKRKLAVDRYRIVARCLRCSDIFDV